MSYKHLTQKERYFIYHMKIAGWSAAKSGQRIGRHRSTVSRELKRNTSYWGHSLDDIAQRKADHSTVTR
jgi:IS30 family transposase